MKRGKGTEPDVETETPQEEVSLETALDRLEEITRQLEGGELELTESLALYEEGVRLLRVADGILDGAEDVIQHLRGEVDGARLPSLEDSP